uniref:Vesicular glutamate transporter 3-like n=1 Tax=Crassostrea virginica TaxID=6565 RepID=A0A8B8DRV8_CRAVI|nr:vesicular glutamate transporter 3-like [Crassostrea virginica]XP_022330394.1 vesicular glutamate transporter 3-like [Crassostrea virginica]
MGCPKRVIVVLLSFLGFLILFGFRTVFTMVMVYVITDNDNDEETIFKCTVNGTAWDLQLDWSVATSQYFNTAYFVGYVLTQLPGGYLAVRFSPAKMLGGSILFSGICFLILAFFMKYSPVIVFVTRFIQGTVEGVLQPAMSSVLSAWAPKSERARIVGFSFSGVYLSTSLASLVTGVGTCYVSWNFGLFVYGILGILLSFVWLYAIYDSPDQHPDLSEKERMIFQEEGSNVQLASAALAKNIPWKSIVTSPPVWALLLANFTRSWVFATMVTEIPQYFADVFRLNVATIGFLTFFPPLLMSVFIVFGGILMDVLIQRKKFSTTAGRKLSIAIGFGPEAIIVMALGFVPSYTTASVLLVLAEGLAGLGIAGYRVNPVDLSPQYASVLTGVSRSGQLGATVSTGLAGALRQKNAESWQKILLITGAVHLFMVIIYGIFGSGNQQEWGHPVYEKLVKPKKEPPKKYGSTSQTSEKVEMNGTLANGCPSKKGTGSIYDVQDTNKH